jgi:hypothetical protein
MRQLIKEVFQQDRKKTCYSYFLNSVIKNRRVGDYPLSAVVIYIPPPILIKIRSTWPGGRTT